MLERTPLLMERTRPSKTSMPKSRTRRINSVRHLGPTRENLLSRIGRRLMDKLRPQAREVYRGREERRQERQKGEKPLIKGRVSPRKLILKKMRSQV